MSFEVKQKCPFFQCHTIFVSFFVCFHDSDSFQRQTSYAIKCLPSGLVKILSCGCLIFFSFALHASYKLNLYLKACVAYYHSTSTFENQNLQLFLCYEMLALRG